jgi:hypothetical protein
MEEKSVSSSTFIWCPKDVIKTKEGMQQNSVGPRHNIGRCLKKKCALKCEELRIKVAELKTVNRRRRMAPERIV